MKLALLLGMLIAVPASATVLFQDDFSGGPSVWQFDSPPEWTVVNGWLQLQMNGASNPSTGFVGDPAWTDYRIDCDVVQLSGVNKFCYFRYQNPTTGYFINFRSPWWQEDDPGSVRLFKLDNLNRWSFGSWTLIQVASYPNSNGTIYHLAIEASGPRISAFVDGQEVLAWEDPDNPVLSGSVGLGGFFGATPEYPVIRWDNFRVTDLSAVPTRSATWGKIKALY